MSDLYQRLSKAGFGSDVLVLAERVVNGKKHDREGWLALLLEDLGVIGKEHT